MTTLYRFATGLLLTLLATVAAAFAEYVRQRLQPLGVKVTILGPEQVLKAGMGAL